MDKLPIETALCQKALMEYFDGLDTALKNTALASAALAIGTGSKTRIKIPSAFAFVRGGLQKTTAPATAYAYQVLSSAGLAIGTGSKAKVLIANTVSYLSNSVFCTKTTAEVAFTATAMDIPASTTVQEACYLLSLAANGTPTLTMGVIATGAGTAVVPATPASGTAIGYVRVAVAIGATPFDASTDLLDAAHLTVTYVSYTFGSTVGGSCAPGEVALTATSHDIAPNALLVQEACYLLSVDANSLVTVTMGDIADGAGNAVLPNVPAGQTPIGYARIAVAAGSTKFDATSDNLDAAHLTVTYSNLGFTHPRFDSN